MSTENVNFILLVLLAASAGVKAQFSGPNIALGKTAFQSNFILPAGYGIDGDSTNCDLSSGPFSVAAFKPLAAGLPKWWAVYLGALYTVEGVRLKNIDPFYGLEYNQVDFYIGVTETSPQVTPPASAAEFDICYHQVAAIAVSDWTDMPCDANIPPGQYLIVFDSTLTVNEFSFCEIEIYGTLYVPPTTPPTTQLPPTAGPAAGPAASSGAGALTQKGAKKGKRNTRCKKSIYRSKHRKQCGWFKTKKNRSRVVRGRQTKRARRLQRSRTG